jgi:hypothetical protein
MIYQECFSGRLGVGGSNPLAPTNYLIDPPTFPICDSDAILTRGSHPCSAVGFVFTSCIDSSAYGPPEAHALLGPAKLRDGSGAGPKAGTVRMKRSAVAVRDGQNRVLAMRIGDEMAAATFA